VEKGGHLGEKERKKVIKFREQKLKLKKTLKFFDKASGNDLWFSLYLLNVWAFPFETKLLLNYEFFFWKNIALKVGNLTIIKKNPLFLSFHV
jgi:hypothetical protein